MNEKKSKKIRKETRRLHERELHGYRSLPFWKRLQWAIRVLLASA